MIYSHGNLVGGRFTKGSDPAWDWVRAGGGYDENRDFFSVHWEVQERNPGNVRLHVEAPDKSTDQFLNSIKQQVVEAILRSGIANIAAQAGYTYRQGSRISAEAIHNNKSTEAFRVVLDSEQREATSEEDIEVVNRALGSYINGVLEPFRAQLDQHFRT